MLMPAIHVSGVNPSSSLNILMHLRAVPVCVGLNYWWYKTIASYFDLSHSITSVFCAKEWLEGIFQSLRVS